MADTKSTYSTSKGNLSLGSAIRGALEKPLAIQGFLGPVPQAQMMALDEIKMNYLGHEISEWDVTRKIKEEAIKDPNNKRKAFETYQEIMRSLGVEPQYTLSQDGTVTPPPNPYDTFASAYAAEIQEINEAMAKSKSTLENWSKVQALTDARRAQQEKDGKERDKGVAPSTPGKDMSHAPVFDWDEINAPGYTPDISRREQEEKQWGRPEIGPERGRTGHDFGFGRGGYGDPTGFPGRSFGSRRDDGGDRDDRRGGRPTTDGRRRTVDYEYEAIYGAARDNSDEDRWGVPDRDVTHPPSYDWDEINAPAYTPDETRDEPVGGNDRSENGWSGMGQNEEWHEGGLVSDNDLILGESAMSVNAQEGEFVLSRAAVALLGEDLLARINDALRHGDRQTAQRLRNVFHRHLSPEPPMPEADIKALMAERPYWDSHHPGHPAVRARVAREFRVAFPGYAKADKEDHIGGLITDHDPDTYLDDFRLDIPEETFIVSRIATRLAGIPALARLNALAEGGDPALAAHLKRDIEAVFGLKRAISEDELRAMMRDRRYSDQSHPEHTAYCKMIARGFRRAYPG